MTLRARHEKGPGVSPGASAGSLLASGVMSGRHQPPHIIGQRSGQAVPVSKARREGAGSCQPPPLTMGSIEAFLKHFRQLFKPAKNICFYFRIRNHDA